MGEMRVPLQLRIKGGGQELGRRDERDPRTGLLSRHPGELSGHAPILSRLGVCAAAPGKRRRFRTVRVQAPPVSHSSGAETSSDGPFRPFRPASGVPAPEPSTAGIRMRPGSVGS
ncbi:hypothetical protein GCM10027408_04740 [Microbacterium tumbae]